jgi:hypothetical protein
MTDATVKAMIQAVNRQSYKAYIARGLWKTAAAYELHVWSYMREFFTGGDAFGFIDNMASEIENQFGRAWREGAAEMGVEPGDFTDEDDAVLEAMITNEQNYLDGIAGDIEAFIAEGGHTDTEFNARFRNRAALWGNGYNGVVNDAKLHFGNKEKLEWILGATEQHCTTCQSLNGIVAWAREWDEGGVKPQGSMLACGGWKCDCSLEPTDKRRSSGALDRIMSVMMQ